MNDVTVEMIGYAFCIASGFGVIGLFIALVAYINIRATHYFVDMLGGWAVFNEFRKFKKRQNKRCLCDGCERKNLRLGGYQPCASKHTGEGAPPNKP